jgi:nitric oxide reductase large subunit
MLIGVSTMLTQIKYLFGQTKPTIIVGILPLSLLLLIILSIVCFVGIKNDPDAKKKEKKQKGYIKHLIGLIMGIGSIYGFMAILYYFHMNPIS